MAYALIAWNSPDATQAQIDTIEAGFDTVDTIRFFTGLRLVEEDGPRWREVMQYVHDVVKENPGMEAMVIMPQKGARTGGWVEAPPPPPKLAFAREIMNMSGSDTYPVLFKAPAAAGEDDWRNGEQWNGEDDR